MNALRWRFRVWAWRLSAVLSLLGGCAHTQDAADAIARRCTAAIAAASDEATATAIAAGCHREIEALR